MKAIIVNSLLLTAALAVSCGTVKDTAVSSASSDQTIDLGYGSASKSSNAFSVSEASMTEDTEMMYNDIYDYLRNRVAGVDVSESSGGGIPRITIRGEKTIGVGADQNPLFIVDGKMVQDLGIVLPNQVHSVQVLKGAAASAYGSRSANGVIMVTTKFAYEEAQREAELKKAAKLEKKNAKKK